MKVLICRDDGQLRRVEGAIAAIQSASPGYRQSKRALLAALEIERASLLQYSHHRRAPTDRIVSPPKRFGSLDASASHATAA